MMHIIKPARTFTGLLILALLCAACTAPVEKPAIEMPTQKPEEIPASAAIEMPAIVEDAWETLPDEAWFRKLDAMIAEAPVLDLPELPQGRTPEQREDGLYTYTRLATEGTIRKSEIYKLEDALAGEEQEDIRELLSTFGLRYERYYYTIGIYGRIPLETEVREFLSGDVISLQCGSKWTWEAVELVFVRQAGNTYRFAAIFPKNWKYGCPELTPRAFRVGGRLFYQTEGSHTGGTGISSSNALLFCLDDGHYETLAYALDYFEDDVCYSLTYQDEDLLMDNTIAFAFQAKKSYYYHSSYDDIDTEENVLEKYMAINYHFNVYYANGVYTVCYDKEPILDMQKQRFPIALQSQDENFIEVLECILYYENIHIEGCGHLMQQAYREQAAALATALAYQPANGSDKIYLEKVDTTPEVSGILAEDEFEKFIDALDTLHFADGGASALSPILTAHGLTCSGKAFTLRSDRTERWMDVVTVEEGLCAPVRVITVEQLGDSDYEYLQLFFIQEQDVWRFSSILERNGEWYYPGEINYHRTSLIEIDDVTFYCYRDHSGIVLHPLKDGEAVSQTLDFYEPSRRESIILDFTSVSSHANDRPLCTFKYVLNIQDIGLELPFTLYNDWDGKGFYTYNTDYLLLLEEDGMQIPYMRDLAREIITLSFQCGMPYTREDAPEEYHSFIEQYGQG